MSLSLAHEHLFEQPRNCPISRYEAVARNNLFAKLVQREMVRRECDKLLSTIVPALEDLGSPLFLGKFHHKTFHHWAPAPHQGRRRRSRRVARVQARRCSKPALDVAELRLSTTREAHFGLRYQAIPLPGNAPLYMK